MFPTNTMLKKRARTLGITSMTEECYDEIRKNANNHMLKILSIAMNITKMKGLKTLNTETINDVLILSENNGVSYIENKRK